MSVQQESTDGAKSLPITGVRAHMNLDTKRPEVTYGYLSMGAGEWSHAMTTLVTTPVSHSLSTIKDGGCTEPMWLTVHAAARRWNVCERTVERLLVRYPEATLRLGRSLRVDVLAVERALRGAGR